MGKVLEDVMGITEDWIQWTSRNKYVNYSPDDFGKEMMEKYPYLFEHSMTLFEKSIKGDFNKREELEQLEYMFDMSEKVKASSNQERAYKDVSVVIGKKYADKYVKPLVDKLDKEGGNNGRKKKNELADMVNNFK